MRSLVCAAWAVFLADAAGVGWLTLDGLSSVIRLNGQSRWALPNWLEHPTRFC
jgi:hypothetical protein